MGLEYLSNRTEELICLAQQARGDLNHNFLGTEHVVAGLANMAPRYGPLKNLFEKRKITYKEVVKRITEIEGKGIETVLDEIIAIEPKLETLVEESYNLQNEGPLKPEYLLYGIIASEIDTIGKKVLQGFGLTVKETKPQSAVIQEFRRIVGI